MKRSISNKGKVLAAASLIAVLGIGGIRAYMTDHETAENSFTVGKVDFNLYETNWDGERPDGSIATPSEATPSDATPSNALGINQAKEMYAGKVIPKNPAIKNNSKNDAYLRMTVRIPTAYVVTAKEDGTPANNGQPQETELFTYEENAGSGMRRRSDAPVIETDTSSGIPITYHIYEYAYTGGGSAEIPVPAGYDIPALFDSVTFANVIEGQVDEQTEFIRVDFKAIQSGGFLSPEEAWATYERQNPGT